MGTDRTGHRTAVRGVPTQSGYLPKRPPDPALASTGGGGADGFARDLAVSPGGIYVFDFDGVIASPFEDQAYKAPVVAGEDCAVMEAAERLGVRCQGMEYRYRRHLVFQAALWRLGIPVGRGPAFAQAAEAARIGQMFVLTARSGWFAVERCRSFLADHDIIPVDMFTVGRVGKVAQIGMLCREFPGRTVTFIEDSAAHLQSVAAAGFGCVDLVLVGGDETVDGEDIRRRCLGTIAAAAAEADPRDAAWRTPPAAPPAA